MSTEITYRVALENLTHEAVVRQSYKDSVDVWTWAVGMTNATGHRVERYIGNPQPLEHCLRIYAWALNNYADGVRKAFAGFALSEAQFAAALSFHWNTGAIGRASWVRLVKQGKLAEAQEAFMEWKNPPEIVGRREKERDLFFKGVWSQTGLAAEYTQVTPTGQIVWSSRKQIDVSKTLRAALGAKDTPPVLDQAPQPDAPVLTPTLSPAPAPAPPPAPRPVPIPTETLPERPARERKSVPGWVLILIALGLGAIGVWHFLF